MQHTNGSYHTNGQQPPTTSLSDATDAPTLRQASPRPKRITVGRIVTCIFANPTSWGEIAWKVEQVREKQTLGGERRYGGFYADDLQDAMRGLYQAKRWIRKIERRRRGSWFWWW